MNARIACRTRICVRSRKVSQDLLTHGVARDRPACVSRAAISRSILLFDGVLEVPRQLIGDGEVRFREFPLFRQGSSARAQLCSASRRVFLRIRSCTLMEARTAAAAIPSPPSATRAGARRRRLATVSARVPPDNKRKKPALRTKLDTFACVSGG